MAQDPFTFTWKSGRSPEAFMARLALFEEALDRQLEQAMQQAAQLLEAEAKGRAPVDTGTLRASIASEVRSDVQDQIQAIVGTNVEYGFYQEYGTSKMGAQPYLRPAIEAVRPEVLELFRDAVRDAAATAGFR